MRELCLFFSLVVKFAGVFVALFVSFDDVLCDFVDGAPIAFDATAADDVDSDVWWLMIMVFFRDRCFLQVSLIIYIHIYVYGGFLKWWYPTTIGFPIKHDYFGVFWGYHHLKETPHIYIQYIYIYLYLYLYLYINNI